MTFSSSLRQMEMAAIPPLKGVRGLSLFRSGRFSQYRDNPPAASAADPLF